MRGIIELIAGIRARKPERYVTNDKIVSAGRTWFCRRRQDTSETTVPLEGDIPIFVLIADDVHVKSGPSRYLTRI